MTLPAPAVPTRVNPNAVLGLVAVAQFMIVLDATIVNVALPTIQGDLGFSQQNLLWVLNAYTLVFGGFLLLGGRLADRLGRRRLFMAGTALFAGASLICGVAQSEATLLAARGAQGLGGALVSPAALSIILTTFAEGTERNRALAVWGAIAGAGGAIGLLLGGVIVEALSWRWIFFVNVPIGALLLAAAPRRIPESRSQGAAAGYDVGGAIAITLGTIAFVYVLIEAESWGWGSGRTLGGFAAAALLIAAFVLIERRHQNPLIPLRIFSNRSLAAADVTMLLVAAALFGVFFFCTLYLQQVLGYDALKTGLAYLPMSASLIAASNVASRLVDRFTPKPVLASGLLVSTAGLLLLTRISGDGDYASHVLPATVVLGIGLGMSLRTGHDRGHQRGRAAGLRARVRAAQHDAASRRIAGFGDPLVDLDTPHQRRAGGGIVAAGGAHRRLQGRVRGRCLPVRAGPRGCGGGLAWTRPEDQGWRNRADCAFVCALSVRPARRIPGSPRGRRSPADTCRRAQPPTDTASA